jgi:hypothetical protein
MNSPGMISPRIQGTRAALGSFIALLSLPAVFFLGSMALVFMVVGGFLLGSSLAIHRGPVVRTLVTLIVIAGTVTICMLLLMAIL